MRIRAFAWRIIMQLFHDKRTTFLILFAPVLILTLVYLILDSDGVIYKIGIVSVSENLEEQLDQMENIKVIHLDKSEQTAAIKDGTVTASLSMNADGTKVDLFLDGSNASDAKKIKNMIQAAITKDTMDHMSDSLQSASEILKKSGMQETENGFSVLELNTDYVYGQEDISMFDEFGASLIGIIVFFLTFIIAGINFLTERSSGTLEKLLSMPVRQYEIITGYVVGFSVLALLQTFVVTAFTIYILGMSVSGNIGFVFLINLLTAVVALTLGILLSTVANSEFQMVQFIPIVIIPQIFLCGLFHLAEGWETISHLIPLYYTSHALKEVMLKGSGWSLIRNDVIVLICFSLLNMVLNIWYLKKQCK